METILTFISTQLIQLQWIGELTKTGVLTKAGGRCVETACLGAEMTFLARLGTCISTGSLGHRKLAIFTFCTTVGTGLVSGLLISLRERQKMKDQILDTISTGETQV